MNEFLINNKKRMNEKKDDHDLYNDPLYHVISPSQ